MLNADKNSRHRIGSYAAGVCAWVAGRGVFLSISVLPLSGRQVRAVQQQVPALAIVWQIIRRLLHITGKMEMFIGNFLLLLRPLNAF